jgi:hypothetical protein
MDRRQEATAMLTEAELLFPDNELLHDVRARLMPETP